jgi:exosortase/archaeosortase family protein
MANATHGTLRTLAIFAVTMGVFSAAYYREEATPWHLRLTAALAYSSSAILSALGQGTSVTERPQVGARLSSYVVHDDRVAVDIAIDCNGAWAFAIFLASILAVPSSWRAKAWGVGLGVPALWAINTVRVVSLFYVAVYVPTVFEALHLYVWQFLIIAAALLLLMLWAEYFLRPADA